MSKTYIGVDLGGTKTAVVISSSLPVCLERIEFPTLPEEGPTRGVDAILQAIRKLLKRNACGSGEIAAIGVSCGSPLDRVHGVIQAPPNMATWVDVPIRKILEDAFHAPCLVENDANAGAVAEHRYGAGRGVKHMVFLTLGTGLGAGIILNGEIYHGAEDSAGEIGHVRLTRSGPVGYGKAGSVEGWASGGGMARLAISMAAKPAAGGARSVLRERLAAQGTLTAKDVVEAAHAGDALARRVLELSGKKLGQAIAILIDLLNPQRIVLGSLAARIGEPLLAPMRKEVEREALPQAARDCEIVLSELGERIGDVAALCVAAGFVGPGERL
ncbi:MAG TPA: ROK family protein [Acidobacteriaceae bacterium]|nr:ROK family protein [Acidobacteriaceae bacterium]